MASVLIVEDEGSLRETLSLFLEREGHRVISVADGRAAFDNGISASPDVLVTDWMLKNHVHGLHVSEALKAVNPGLHTILITGFPSKDLITESDRCGVLQLLEKPFDLAELKRAVERACLAEKTPGRTTPLAVIELDTEGRLDFVSARARELFERSAAGREPSHLQEVLGVDIMSQLDGATTDWILCSPVSPLDADDDSKQWYLRARRLTGDRGYLAVILHEDEQDLTGDTRVRLLLDHRSRSKAILPDHGPVVVIEPDGAVRRLLVSQIERIGTLCYPADDLDSAIRLLVAEPRVVTVLIDHQFAGDRMPDWVRSVREARPGIAVIAIGGVGSKDDLVADGVTSVLLKPWRIMDLLEAMSH